VEKVANKARDTVKKMLAPQLEKQRQEDEARKQADSSGRRPKTTARKKKTTAARKKR